MQYQWKAVASLYDISMQFARLGAESSRSRIVAVSAQVGRNCGMGSIADAPMKL